MPVQKTPYLLTIRRLLWPIASHFNISFLLPFVFLPCHVMYSTSCRSGCNLFQCALSAPRHSPISTPTCRFLFSTTFHSSFYSNLLQLGKPRGSHSYIYLRHDLFKKKMNELYHFVYLYSLLLLSPIFVFCVNMFGLAPPFLVIHFSSMRSLLPTYYWRFLLEAKD